MDISPWYQTGTPVNIVGASLDAEFILEPGEFGAEWRRCDVPASALNLPETFEAYCEEYCSHSHSPEALETVSKWMAEVVDARKSLEDSPVLLSIEDDGVEIIDGHHRIAIAYYRHDLIVFPACVAISLSKTRVEGLAP